MKKTIVFTCFLYVFSCLWAENFASYVCNDLALKQQSCFFMFLGTTHKSLATGGKSPKTGSQIAEIENIALQCPYTGGEAVYRARVLHTALTGFTAYNDSVNCAIQGISWRFANATNVNSTSTQSVEVVPNPTNGKTNFIFAYPISENTTLHIYNGLGQKVAEYKAMQGEKSIPFDMENLSKGLYYYLINGLTGKFIVEK